MFKSKISIIFYSILLVYLLFLFSKSSFVMNGNNKKNIIKVIHSLDIYENKDSLEILKIIDSKDDRFVAFLYNNSPAYAQFIKNDFGNYKWTYSENRSGESLSIFKVNLSIERILVITNNENNIAKIIMKANGVKIIEDEMNVGKKSALFYEVDNLPKPIDNGYEYTYEFFDKNGNPITEED